MKSSCIIMPAVLLASTLVRANNCNYYNNVDSTVVLEEAYVTASRVPMPADKATRLVQVLSSEDIEKSSAQSVNDLLKLVAGVDVRQRGAYGVQTDIGINGGNEDQLTVLLNGVNISNPQTGHLTMDLPVSLNDIERIEVIEGGASRVYGSSAFSGAINIITKSAKENMLSASVTGGSYGTLSVEGGADLLSGLFTNHISGGYTRSDGASANSDFKKYNAYWNEKYSNDFVDVVFQAGLSSMKYGANTFYGTGSSSQYEEDTKYLVSLQAETKGRLHFRPQVYWNRSYDHYVWIRNNPSAYENYHQTNVYGANVNVWLQWALGRTSVGLEFRRENILSTRLGKEIDTNSINMYPGYKYKDGRSGTGVYLEHDIVLDRWSFSLGLLAYGNSSLDESARLYPGVDISCSPLPDMRVYASFNKSLRTPTYTDLYYNGPGIEGNLGLKPEKSTDYAVGCSFRKGALKAQVKGFYRNGTDMIDWVKREGAATWTTANSDINNIGAEAYATIEFAKTNVSNPFVRSLTLSYCYNHQERTDAEATSTYSSQLVYLRHKFVATLNHRLFGGVSAQWEFVLKDRTGWFDNAITNERQDYGSFGQLDLKLQWTGKRANVYVQGNNLTSRKYYDIANVRQPGFWITAGAKISIGIDRDGK